jgi:hypothetical protein
MEPRSAALGIGPSDDKQRTMQLRYQAGAVTGTTTNPDPAKGPPTGEVHAEVPGDIVDQRIDWAALMSAPLAPGAAIAFTVYDPWTGISQVTAEVRAPERIAVAAGAFSVIHVTYRMAKPQRPVEQFELWVSEAPPRFLVREDFPNGATTQLVAAAP